MRTPRSDRATPRSQTKAFTLVEILVATAILLVIIVVLLQVTGKITDIWKSSSGKISAFQSARSAFSTITRTVARANLNTYNDYVDATGNYRYANPTTFAPVKFERTSELHFISGRSSEFVPGGDAQKNPGHSIFFQAPLGDTDTPDLTKLNRTLNSVGFYIQYGQLNAGLVPSWLSSFVSNNKRFRLMQFVQPTEELNIYTHTAEPSYTNEIKWVQNFISGTTAPRARVLAEDVLLLVVRPRLSPKDEEMLGRQQSPSFKITDANRGTLISPNYQYDSRAWQPGYPSGKRVEEVVLGAVLPVATRVKVMRNQTPPIVDIAMVCADRHSMARFVQTSDTPITQVQIPGTLFTDSSKLGTDLETYGTQLSAAKIRYRVFRTSVDVQSAKWSSILN